MTKQEARIGTRVRSLITFSGVPKGTEGVIDEEYSLDVGGEVITGVMVAWDLPDRPLPPGYKEWNGKPAFCLGQPLRDGFCKRTELGMLEVVKVAVDG